MTFTHSALSDPELFVDTDVVHAISRIYIGEHLAQEGIAFITHFHHHDRVRRLIELLEYPFIPCNS